MNLQIIKEYVKRVSKVSKVVPFHEWTNTAKREAEPAKLCSLLLDFVLCTLL